MPYGNKGLHFGHIAGVFVPADVYARFLRDRIGPDNVLFVSGTDCFGSPINEGYRKLVEAGDFDGTIADYVQMNHDAQKAALDAYDISLDIFEGSGIGLSGVKQQEMTDAFITRLYDNGWLEKLSTPRSTMRRRAPSSTAVRSSALPGCRAANPRRPTPTSATWATSTIRSTSSRPNPRSRARRPRCAR